MPGCLPIKLTNKILDQYRKDSDFGLKALVINNGFRTIFGGRLKNYFGAADIQKLNTYLILHGIEYLILDHCSLTANQLQALFKGVSTLRYLDLSENPIRNAGAAELQNLPMLRFLRVQNCAITDEGVESILKNPWITALDISTTYSTKDGHSHSCCTNFCECCCEVGNELCCCSDIETKAHFGNVLGNDAILKLAKTQRITYLDISGHPYSDPQIHEILANRNTLVTLKLDHFVASEEHFCCCCTFHPEKLPNIDENYHLNSLYRLLAGNNTLLNFSAATSRAYAKQTGRGFLGRNERADKGYLPYQQIQLLTYLAKSNLNKVSNLPTSNFPEMTGWFSSSNFWRNEWFLAYLDALKSDINVYLKIVMLIYAVPWFFIGCGLVPIYLLLDLIRHTCGMPFDCGLEEYFKSCCGIDPYSLGPTEDCCDAFFFNFNAVLHERKEASEQYDGLLQSLRDALKENAKSSEDFLNAAKRSEIKKAEELLTPEKSNRLHANPYASDTAGNNVFHIAILQASKESFETPEESNDHNISEDFLVWLIRQLPIYPGLFYLLNNKNQAPLDLPEAEELGLKLHTKNGFPRVNEQGVRLFDPEVMIGVYYQTKIMRRLKALLEFDKNMMGEKNRDAYLLSGLLRINAYDEERALSGMLNCDNRNRKIEYFGQLLGSNLNTLFIECLAIAHGFAEKNTPKATAFAKILKYFGSLIPAPAAATFVEFFVDGALAAYKKAKSYQAGIFSSIAEHSIQESAALMELVVQFILFRHQEQIAAMKSADLPVFAKVLVGRIYTNIKNRITFTDFIQTLLLNTGKKILSQMADDTLKEIFPEGMPIQEVLPRNSEISNADAEKPSKISTKDKALHLLFGIYRVNAKPSDHKNNRRVQTKLLTLKSHAKPAEFCTVEVDSLCRHANIFVEVDGGFDVYVSSSAAQDDQKNLLPPYYATEAEALSLKYTKQTFLPASAWHSFPLYRVRPPENAYTIKIRELMKEISQLNLAALEQSVACEQHLTSLRETKASQEKAERRLESANQTMLTIKKTAQLQAEEYEQTITQLQLALLEASVTRWATTSEESLNVTDYGGRAAFFQAQQSPSASPSEADQGNLANFFAQSDSVITDQPKAVPMPSEFEEPPPITTQPETTAAQVLH